MLLEGGVTVTGASEKGNAVPAVDGRWMEAIACAGGMDALTSSIAIMKFRDFGLCSSTLLPFPEHVCRRLSNTHTLGTVFTPAAAVSPTTTDDQISRPSSLPPNPFPLLHVGIFRAFRKHAFVKLEYPPGENVTTFLTYINYVHGTYVFGHRGISHEEREPIKALDGSETVRCQPIS